MDFTLALALFVCALFLRLLLLIPFEFDGLYGQDAYAYYDFALELRRVLSEGYTPGPLFWPLGYPALLAAVFSLLGEQPTVGQIVSVTMGASLAPGVYALARQMGCGRTGALIAGILMAVCGQALQSSLVLMADIPAQAWAVFSAVTLWRYLQGSSWRWLVGAAILLALASITRWLYLALAVPWAAALLLKGPVRWRDGVIAIIPAGAIVLAQLAYSATGPFPTFNHAWVEGWSLTNAFRREFINVDGHFLYEMENWRFYAQPFYDEYYLSPVFTPFLFIGLLALIRLKQHAIWTMLAAWALAPYLFLAGIPYQNIRFPLIMFPAVALLVGLGIHSVLLWLQQQHVLEMAGRMAIAGLILLGGLRASGTAQATIQTFIANQERDKAVARWAAQQIPAGEMVYTFGLTLTMRHYTPLDVHEIYYESPETLDARWARGDDDYLLLNVWNVENQWAGREPQVAFHWLRDTRGLVELGRNGYYTLFRVEG